MPDARPGPVSCAGHGDSMEYDAPRFLWRCTAAGCGAVLTCEELRQLQSENPGIGSFVISEPRRSCAESRRERRLPRTEG